MDPARQRRVEAVFTMAVAGSREHRAAVLAEQCGGDASLRAAVESLLAHHDASSRFLEPPAPAAGPMIDSECGQRDEPAVLPAIRRIASYTLVDVLGVGGMGVVYRAEQDNPRRTVALKLIRPGVVSSQVLRRFQHEAQILGRLQHPGIAQIFEAGTADAGQGPQPYFAMELVDGVLLNEFVGDIESSNREDLQTGTGTKLKIPAARIVEGTGGRERLGTRGRVELVARICDAVQHAHQKGVIHRDLKPSNILIQEAVGAGAEPTGLSVGQPKVLDFGVARAIDSDIQATTFATDIGQVIGTVPYMSPEQCMGDPHEVDTRSDIYALGVIGYQLLTGRLPYDLSQKSLPEAVRVIREDEPRPLSSLNKMLRGDLETIIMKALEKEKDRRYPSASDLAADLRRVLRDEPIVARPASSFYRLRKFARRNKALVAGVAVVLIVLTAGVIGTTWQAVHATRARDRAINAEQIAEARRVRAEREAEKSSKIQQFLVDMLASANPETAKGRDVTILKDMLEDASRKVANDLVNQPEVRIAIHETIALTYRGLGLYAAAEPHLTTALELSRTVLGEAHRDTLLTARNLGRLLWDQGKYSEAQAVLTPALEKARTVLAADETETIAGFATALGHTLRSMGRVSEVEPLYREALEVNRTRFGDEDRETLVCMNNLASLLEYQGKLGEAELLYRRTLEGQRRLLTEDHPHTVSSMANLSGLLLRTGKPEEAETLLREALDIEHRILAPDHPNRLRTQGRLASLLQRTGRLAEAETLFRQTMDGLKRTLGPDHLHSLVSANNLANLLYDLERHGEAEELLRETLASLRRTVGDEHPETINTLSNLAHSLRVGGEPAQAEAMFRQALALRERILGANHAATLATLGGLARALRDQHKYVEAEQCAHRAFQAAQASLPATHLTTLVLQTTYGDCLTDLKLNDEAESNLRESYLGLTRTVGRRAPAVVEALRALIRFYEASEQPEKASEHRAILASVTEREAVREPVP